MCRMLERCSEEDLAMTSGGLNWEGNRLSDTVEDRRTPIETTGDFARYDRGLDAYNAVWGQVTPTPPISTPGDFARYDRTQDSINEYFKNLEPIELESPPEPAELGPMFPYADNSSADGFDGGAFAGESFAGGGSGSLDEELLQVAAC